MHELHVRYITLKLMNLFCHLIFISTKWVQDLSPLADCTKKYCDCFKLTYAVYVSI